MPALGEKSRYQRPAPDDFRDLAPTMTRQALIKHYHCNHRVVDRWLAESGASIATRRYRTALPAEVATLARTMSMRELADAVKWSPDTLRARMRVERPDLFAMTVKNGLAKRSAMAAVGRQKARELANERKAQQRERQKAASPNAAKSHGRSPLKSKVDRDGNNLVLSQADKAMRWLQRVGPCYPMRIHNPKLTDYSFKGIRMSGEALIAEARKLGWNPDAWRELAA